jgi:ABC-type Zn2+ transport system substrate-binding protein/surface adhesin
MNLVGFEHKASSKKDIAAIQQAELTLRQQDALFVLSGAGCQHISSVIDTTKLIDADDHKQKDDHHKESHKESHDNDKHEDNENHSEMIANYSYRCNKDSNLSSITLSLFKAFPGIHKVHAMWVTPTKQGSIMLSKNSPMIKFED